MHTYMYAHTNASEVMSLLKKIGMQVGKVRAYQFLPQQNSFIKEDLILLLSAERNVAAFHGCKKSQNP